MDFEQFGQFAFQLLTSLGTKLLAAIIILVIGTRLIKASKRWIITTPKLAKIEESLRSFLVSFSSILLYILLVITIAMVLGVPVTSFITILASCGVAIGLALQGSLSNFAGGIMILLFKPFKIGDYIEAAGESGTVTEISVVYTVLLTPDNKKITIPNGTLTNSVIENYSSEPTRRVDFTFETAYDCEIEKVKSIITEVISSHPLALQDPEPLVRLSKHSESSMTYTVRVWCKKDDYWNLNFDIIEGVKKAFDENGIVIPYKQVEVHLNNK